MFSRVVGQTSQSLGIDPASRPRNDVELQTPIRHEACLLALPDAIFKAQDLTKTCTTGELAVTGLCGIDPKIVRGEIVVLLGPVGK